MPEPVPEAHHDGDGTACSPDPCLGFLGPVLARLGRLGPGREVYSPDFLWLLGGGAALAPGTDSVVTRSGRPSGLPALML